MTTQRRLRRAVAPVQAGAVGAEGAAAAPLLRPTSSPIHSKIGSMTMVIEGEDTRLDAGAQGMAPVQDRKDERGVSAWVSAVLFDIDGNS